MREQTPPWWNYVKHIIREYPALCEELKAMKNPRVTTTYKERVAMKGEVPRPVEKAAICALAPNKQKKYDAVREAVEKTQNRYPKNCQDRLKIIEMVYFNGRYNINGAAMRIPCHPNTAIRWQGDFIRLVGEILQLP